MISRVVFVEIDGSLPRDLDNHLDDWTVVGTQPSSVSGWRFPAQYFDGSGGYQSIAGSARYPGFLAVSVRVVIEPDFDALDGHGPAVLAHLGRLGPTAALYATWGFGMLVNGASTEIQAYWQTPAGTPEETTIATVPTPASGTRWVLGISRERRQVDEVRASINGEIAGSVVTTIDTIYPGVSPITLGCRSNHAVGHDRFYIGGIEQVVLSSSASTPIQELHEWERIVAAERGRDSTIRLYTAGHARRSIRFDPSVRGSVYHGYRVRPLAESQGLFDSRALALDQSMLIPSAYGSQLERWERALGIGTTAVTIATRQSNALAAFSDRGGFRLERLTSIGSTLTGDPAPVIFEATNRRTFPFTSIPDEPLTLPFGVCGYGDVELTASGITLRSAETALIWNRSQDALEARLSIGHVPRAVWSLTGRLIEGGALSVQLDDLQNSSTTQWAGITLRGVRTVATHIGIYDVGGNFQVSYRYSDNGVYTPWSLISPMSIGGRIAVFFEERTEDWYVAVSSNPMDPRASFLQVLPLAPFMSSVRALSLTHQSESIASGEIVSRWVDPIFQTPNETTGRQWYIIAENATEKSPVSQNAELRSQDRPTALGHITYAPSMIVGSSDSPIGYTPMRDANVPALALADDARAAYRNTGRIPFAIHRFQSSGVFVRDRVGHRTLIEIAGATVTYGTDGPDNDRRALTIENGTVSGLQVERSEFADTSSGQIACVLVYRHEPGADGILMEKTVLANYRVALRISAGTLELLLADGFTVETLQLAAPAPNQWHAIGWYTDNTGDCAMATATADVADSFALASLSNSAAWIVGSGTTNAADFSIRWLAWFSDSFANEAELSAAVQRVANFSL